MNSKWLEVVKGTAEAGAREDEARHWGNTASSEESYPFSYRWEHVQQVARNGEWLAQQYPEADADVVMAACWLHDVRKVEKNHADRGAEFARHLLRTLDFPQFKIPRVAQAISIHEGLIRPADDWRDSFNEPFRAAPPLRPLEAAILWDADKLSKIGPISHFHFLGWSLSQAVRTGKALTTLEAHDQNSRYIKLVVPRIIASMNTEAAQLRAASQHEAYLAYHKALDTVLNVAPF
jgi:uncharacterized protein